MHQCGNTELCDRHDLIYCLVINLIYGHSVALINPRVIVALLEHSTSRMSHLIITNCSFLQSKRWTFRDCWREQIMSAGPNSVCFVSLSPAVPQAALPKLSAVSTLEVAPWEQWIIMSFIQCLIHIESLGWLTPQLKGNVTSAAYCSSHLQPRTMKYPKTPKPISPVCNS